MKGNTLIETLIYITLLSLLMVGVFSSIYAVIHSGEQNSRAASEENTALLLKKYHD